MSPPCQAEMVHRPSPEILGLADIKQPPRRIEVPVKSRPCVFLDILSTQCQFAAHALVSTLLEWNQGLGHNSPLRTLAQSAPKRPTGRSAYCRANDGDPYCRRRSGAVPPA